MERLGEFDNKVIIEQHNEPENKNVIWKDPDENKYKEYVNGSWVESEKMAIPGQITPELLEDNNQKLRLYGHTVEEVQKLIDDGKCIQCKRAEIMDLTWDEDLRVTCDPLLLMDDTTLENIDLNTIEYILYSASDISNGLLLKNTGFYFYIDALNTFEIDFSAEGEFIACNIGYCSI